MADRTIKRNDLTPPLVIVARDSVGPVDLTGATALFRMVNVLNGATKINAAATPAAGITFTVSGATLTANDHGLNNGESVTLDSTGALPAELSTQTEYFVINAAVNALQLSLVQRGPAITTSGAGTGTHSLLSGRVTYEWQTGDTDTAGTYYGEIQTTVGGEQLTYPNTGQILIEVVTDLA